MSIAEANSLLVYALGRTAKQAEELAAMCLRTQENLPENPVNLLTGPASEVLGRCDFAVVHKDKLDEAIGVVRVACEADHAEPDEGPRLEALLAYLVGQRRKLPT